jgi:hypothetical protein
VQRSRPIVSDDPASRVENSGGRPAIERLGQDGRADRGRELFVDVAGVAAGRDHHRAYASDHEGDSVQGLSKKGTLAELRHILLGPIGPHGLADQWTKAKTFPPRASTMAQLLGFRSGTRAVRFELKSSPLSRCRTGRGTRHDRRGQSAGGVHTRQGVRKTAAESASLGYSPLAPVRFNNTFANCESVPTSLLSSAFCKPPRGIGLPKSAGSFVAGTSFPTETRSLRAFVWQMHRRI